MQQTMSSDPIMKNLQTVRTLAAHHIKALLKIHNMYYNENIPLPPLVFFLRNVSFAPRFAYSFVFISFNCNSII